MPKEERLSAVAKRRRLNGSAVQTNEIVVTTSPSQAPTQLPKVKDQTKIQENGAKIDTQPQVSGPNEFGALVVEDLVQFSSFREIERLNNQTIRVRLSKDQQCFISGRYSLWVKDGVIDYLGAKLHASSQLYNIYSSSVLEIPPILALSNVVEVEIRSHQDEMPACFGLPSFQWASPDGDPFSVSFFVHGYSISVQGDAPPLNKGADTRSANEFGHRLGVCDNASATYLTPTMLVCGKQFIGTTTQFLRIINSVLTTRGRTNKQVHDQGLLLLDLDTNMPITGLPRTSSLVHITKPILGPSFIQTATTYSVGRTSPLSVVSMQYESNNIGSQQCVAQLRRYMGLVKDFKLQGHQNCPLIIRANGWLEHFDGSHMEFLARTILPNVIVCHGPESASHSGQLGAMIAHQSNALPVSIMPIIHMRGPSASLYNELMVRSYFHFRGFYHGCPRWSQLPLELDVYHQVCFIYDTQSDLESAMSIPDAFFESNDLEDVLDGCMVAVVLHENNATDDMSSMVVHKNLPGEDMTNNHSAAECLGFGLVTGFTLNGEGLWLSTPIAQHLVGEHRAQGKKLEFVFPRADPDSGFDTAWVQLELGAVLGSKLGKTIYRRKLKAQPTEQLTK